MSLIFEKYMEGYSEGLDLFSGITVETAIMTKEMVEYGTTTSIRNGSSLTTIVSGDIA